MTVSLTAPNGNEQNVSNGEWGAITAMGKAFGVLDDAWSGSCGPVRYTQGQLVELAQRAKQIGRAANYLEWLAESGGAELS